MLSFKGSNIHPEALSRLIRICLLLGIEVTFIPVKEPQRNGCVESFNNTYQQMFFTRQHFDSLQLLTSKQLEFEDYYNNKKPHSSLKKSIQGAVVPAKVHFMSVDKLNILSLSSAKGKLILSGKKIPIKAGKVSYIRFIRSNHKLNILMQSFDLPDHIQYVYVTATLYTKENIIIVKDTEGDVITQYDYKVVD